MWDEVKEHLSFEPDKTHELVFHMAVTKALSEAKSERAMLKMVLDSTIRGLKLADELER